MHYISSTSIYQLSNNWTYFLTFFDPLQAYNSLVAILCDHDNCDKVALQRAYDMVTKDMYVTLPYPTLPSLPISLMKRLSISYMITSDIILILTIHLVAHQM